MKGGAKAPKASSNLSQVQFVGSLLRLSAALYASDESSSIGGKLARVANARRRGSAHPDRKP